MQHQTPGRALIKEQAERNSPQLASVFHPFTLPPRGSIGSSVHVLAVLLETRECP